MIVAPRKLSLIIYHRLMSPGLAPAADAKPRFKARG